MPALLASLIYVHMRPPEYRAVARLQISPAAVVTQSIDGQNTPTVSTDAKSFLTEVQTLTSRPLLKEALNRLKDEGQIPGLEADPIVLLCQKLVSSGVNVRATLKRRDL